MAKDPAFLFYTNDFHSGTQFFSDEQLGKYLRLLMAQHQHGHLSENQVIFICKSYDNHVMSKFAKDSDGLWYNKRLEFEIEKRKSFVDSRSKNKEGKTKKKNISFSYENHMEDRDRNVNEDLIIIKSRDEIFEAITADSGWTGRMKQTYPGKDYKRAFDECHLYFTNRPNPPEVLWVWREKLMTWLSNMKIEKANGKSGTSKNDRTEFNDNELAIIANHAANAGNA